MLQIQCLVESNNIHQRQDGSQMYYIVTKSLNIQLVHVGYVQDPCSAQLSARDVFSPNSH